MFTHTNGVRVSDSALDVALLGRKIEAIKLTRDDASINGGYVGLKDAKDAVEAAMACRAPAGFADAMLLVERLRRELDTARYAQAQAEGLTRAVRADLDAANASRQRLREERNEAQAHVEVLKAAISDHIFGISRLPDLGQPGVDLPF